ncbi:MAG TPA: cytochrome c oxidase subunit 3 [Alphaproteobacteria bacterium]|nr:cytochrome c oxidase subunit 3 [Alphaproteobacteria bacterium]
MSQAATMRTHAAEPVEYSLTDSLGKLGMWMFLAGDAMGFGALIVGYGGLRYYSTNWPLPADVLGIGLTAFMTFVLICSSVTMVKALSAIQHGDQAGLQKFLALTILGGCVFLGLQAYEWTHLITDAGMGVSTPPSAFPEATSLFSTTFFVLTGFHGMHVTGGVIYLLCLLIRAMMGKYTAESAYHVEIAGLYWHFVDLVWILIFTFVYLL